MDILFNWPLLLSETMLTLPVVWENWWSFLASTIHVLAHKLITKSEFLTSVPSIFFMESFHIIFMECCFGSLNKKENKEAFVIFFEVKISRRKQRFYWINPSKSNVHKVMLDIQQKPTGAHYSKQSHFHTTFTRQK